MDKTIVLGQNKLKLVFSLISTLLLVPLLLSPDEDFFRALFIFLINRIIDMVFKKNSDEMFRFLRVWESINQWIGLVVCAISFCAITPDFLALFGKCNRLVGIIVFLVALSCVAKDVFSLLLSSVEENTIKNKIKNEMLAQEDLWN